MSLWMNIENSKKMNNDKKDLTSLIDFVNDIANQKGNEWFKTKLIEKVSKQNFIPEIEEIYEYCIRQILKEQSTKFYSEIKLPIIKSKLIEDFIRMEQFRRDDNFEDFCLAVFQQIEGIVNALSTVEVHELFLKLLYNKTHKIKNKSTGIYEDQLLWQLILYPGLSNEDLNKKTAKHLFEWDFMERYKLILYFFYYNQKIYNYQDFQMNYFLGNELYQSRNLNHRGVTPSEKQKITIEKVKTNSHKYYFKFLGFLEDFTTKINSNI